MKNIRKGTISVETAIGLALLAVIILVVIFSVRNLLSKGKDAAFSVGEGKLPGDSPLPPSHESVPSGIANDFNDFVAAINRYKNGNRCIVPLAKMPDMKDNYFIELYPGGAALRKMEGREVRTYKVETIEGFETCVISFWGAQNFYDNWLDGTIDPPNPAKPEYYMVETARTTRIESQTKLTTPNEPNTASPQNYMISNEERQRYLYKADNAHFCFMPSWNDNIDWGFPPTINNECTRPDSNSPGLDNDCFERGRIIRNIVPICS